MLEKVLPEACRAAILALGAEPPAAPVRVSRNNFRGDRAAALPGLAFELRRPAQHFLRRLTSGFAPWAFLGWR